LYEEFEEGGEEEAWAVLVVLDEPGLFDDDDGELDDVDWDMDPATCCCAMLFSNPCIWMRLFSRLIVSWELGPWGGGEPRAGLSVVDAALGLLDCGEEWKGVNIGASVVARMECGKATAVGG